MGWIDMLSRTYDVCSGLVGEEVNDDPILLPIAHSTANAQVELTVDMEGNLVNELTGIVEKNGKNELTIIPVTEDSAARSNGNFPHPLCDKLCYVAGDYSGYTGEEKEEYFEAYLNGLRKWGLSDYGNPWLTAVLTYVEKRNLISDLASIGLLQLDEAGMLSEKENKIQQISQRDVFIRFAVVEDGRKVDLWKSQIMYESYINYYLPTVGKKELCYVTGREESCTEKHPSKIRNTGDKAKLISGNDESGFTYRGRFETKGDAVSVGYETSQKAHNALRWLLKRQGYLQDGSAIVIWKLPGVKKEKEEELPALEVPNIFENTVNAFSFQLDEAYQQAEEQAGQEENQAEERAEQEENQNVGKRYALLLKQAMQGYAKEFKEDDKVIMMAVDAATTGRLSINYYHEFAGNQFIEKVIDWHENCTWQRVVKQKESGKYIKVTNAPSPREMALAAFGTERGNGYLDCDTDLKKNTVQRILPCIVGLSPKIPLDIVRAAVNRASNPQAYSSFVWENQVLAVACAMLKFNKYKSEKKGDEDMDQEQKRAILYGRLLAILDEIERKAMYTADKSGSDNRLSNAKKLWNVYTRRPKTTFDRLYKIMMRAYMGRLAGGTRFRIENEIGELMNQLNEIEGFTNKPLKEEYLLGYYQQKEKMKPTKDETECENSEKQSEENGNKEKIVSENEKEEGGNE